MCEGCSPTFLWLCNWGTDSRLKESGFDSCAAMSNLGLFTLHYFSLHSCVNEYLAIDNGGCLYEQPLCINCSVAGSFPEKLRRCLNEQICWEVKCKAL